MYPFFPLIQVGMLPEPINKKTRSSMKMIGDLNHIYTLSLHGSIFDLTLGMYIDFVGWALVNMPGMGKIDLTSLIGDLPLRLVGYIIKRDCTEPHSDAKKNTSLPFRLKRLKRRALGELATPFIPSSMILFLSPELWMSQNQRQPLL